MCLHTMRYEIRYRLQDFPPTNPMKISQKRQLDRFKRSLDFIEKRAKDFASGAPALEVRDQLKEVITRAESNSSETAPTKTGRRVYRSDKLAALNALRGELTRVSRTAALIETRDKSFENSFQMPDKRRKDDLAKAARHFIEQYPKVSDKFGDFELHEDDVEKLKKALEAYEQVQATPPAKPARSPRSPAAPNPTVAQGIDLVEALDIIMQNKYDDDDAVKDDWNAASALEVTRRRRKNKGSDD